MIRAEPNWVDVPTRPADAGAPRRTEGHSALVAAFPTVVWGRILNAILMEPLLFRNRHPHLSGDAEGVLAKVVPGICLIILARPRSILAFKFELHVLQVMPQAVVVGVFTLFAD